MRALPAHDAHPRRRATGAGAAGRGRYQRVRRPVADGRDVCRCRSTERRALLDKLPLQAAAACGSKRSTATSRGTRLRRGLGGRHRQAPRLALRARRSKHWLKMKCEASQELVVGGFTDPQGSRVGLGAMLVGYFEGDDFVFAGKVGTGFDTQLLLDLRARLDAIEIRPAVHRATGLPRCAHTGSSRRSWCRSRSWNGPVRQAASSAPARRPHRTRAAREVVRADAP